MVTNSIKSGVSIPDRLFIFEMANNHMGDISHGLRVIRELRDIVKDYDFNFAFKLQYRYLDTFIHPAFQSRTDIKYIKRFSETKLSEDDLLSLVREIKNCGFISICTPFDEASVDRIVNHGFDIIKIASCSFNDWPLLEKATKAGKPLIISTAGADLETLDNVVAFNKHRAINFALMHCVAEYPTSNAGLQLNQIDFLRERYPDVRIGYSTHEHPSEMTPISMAIAKRATIFEKHVGVPTDQYALNDYSANPDQIRQWLDTAKAAFEMNGGEEGRSTATKAELDSLISLRRGVFAKREIKKGENLSGDDVFFAIPTQPGHITANDWSKYNIYIAKENISSGSAVLTTNTQCDNTRKKVYSIVQDIKNILSRAKVIVPGQAELEISHHYGIEKFDEFGITMLTIVNRNYCKKLIIVLPGQKHPEQFHKVKEETFHILYGNLQMQLDGQPLDLDVGSVLTIEPGMRHAFESSGGCVFEEISSTHHINDSFYTDSSIAENKNRKTLLTHWMN